VAGEEGAVSEHRADRGVRDRAPAVEHDGARAEALDEGFKEAG
jgi:hypothetical protein